VYQVFNQSVNILDGLKTWITATIANVAKDILQHPFEEGISGMYAEPQMALIIKYSPPNTFYTCMQ
jgi:hypothetical protein